MDNKYENAKIYTIRCKSDISLIYVGSTIQPLHKRWHTHKSRLIDENFKHYKLYAKMLELGKDEFYIELYESFSCNNKEELNKREGEVIRQIGTLNKIISGRTAKQYYEEHKVEKREYEKQYLSIPENKVKVNAYHLQRYHDNKEEINAKRSEKGKEKCLCDCGSSLRKTDLARHNKSKKHITFMENNNKNLNQLYIYND